VNYPQFQIDNRHLVAFYRRLPLRRIVRCAGRYDA